MASQKVQAGGIDWNYEVAGSGPPLLLIHGWGCSIDTVRSIFQQLARNYTVYALDLPGHGKSSLPPGVWGSYEFTEAIHQFLNALQLHRVHLVSHSVGARFAALLAALHPERVDRVVLAASSGVKPRRKLSYYWKVALAKSGKFAAKYLGSAGEKLKKKIYSRIASADYQSAGELRNSFVKIVNEDIRVEFPRITAPTLLIWGENDSETPVRSAKVFAELIPNSALQILPGAGHYLFIDQPDRFILYVQKFLRGEDFN